MMEEAVDWLPDMVQYLSILIPVAAKLHEDGKANKRQSLNCFTKT
jgi:hypothetical protein